MPVGKDILDIGIGIEFSSLIQEYIPVFACRTIELPQPFYRESFASMNRTILHTGEVIVDKDLASLSIDAYIVLLTLWMLQINATEQKIHWQALSRMDNMLDRIGIRSCLGLLCFDASWAAGQQDSISD